MRSPRRVLAAVLLTGLAAFLLTGLLKGGSVAFSLGVPNNAPVVTLAKGEAFCQEQMTPQKERFDRVQMTLGTFAQRGPSLDMTVRDRTGAVFAHGRLEAGYGDITAAPHQTIRLDHEARARDGMKVCFRNTGRRKVAWYGAGDAAAVPTTAVLGDGTPAGSDVNLVFLGDRRSYLSRLDGILERARLFRAGPLLPGWAYLLVIVGFVGVAAGGLLAAVGSLRTDDD